MSSPFFKTRTMTWLWLVFMGIKRFKIRDDLNVDVDGDVDISNRYLKRIPVQFGVVNGDFSCYFNRLTTLIGVPRECQKFSCNYNELTSLVGSPTKCIDFDCGNNHLTSLIGAPRECEDFDCHDNRLTNLDGAPVKCAFFWGPLNDLTSLVGSPKNCPAMYLGGNLLIDLSGGPEDCTYLSCRDNPGLTDISSVPDGCWVDYDHDAVTRNRAARQLTNLINTEITTSRSRSSGRRL